MANQTKQLNEAVTLPKQEYLRLKQQAQAYRSLATQLFELPLRDTVGEVVADFRDTNLYVDEFLTDLENGLRKSAYAKKYAHQAA